MSYLSPGIRVVRGPDWSRENQDGGEGHVGSVVKIEDSDGAKGKVTVIWDSGREFQYHAGLYDKFDLLVYDSAPTGMTQGIAKCHSCGENGIAGIRWKCAECTDYNLCTPCYNADKHCLNHAFLRYITQHVQGVRVPPRSCSQKIQDFSLFRGAKVIPGPHWKSGNEDDLSQSIGEVTAYSHLGAVKVKWPGKSGGPKQYRSGRQGVVEVITETEAQGNSYYKTHLPVLDVFQAEWIRLKKGDKVAVQLHLDHFLGLQEKFGGKTDNMQQCLEEVGTIIGLSEQFVRAQYPDAEIYILVKPALTRLHSFAVGDTVKITDNYNAAMELQNEHGGWNDKMEICLGKEGQVVDIDKDGDLRVKIATQMWTFSPVNCIPLDRQTLDSGSTHSTTSGPSASDVDVLAESVSNVLLDTQKRGLNGLFKPGQSIKCYDLLKAVREGDVEVVRAMLTATGNLINDSFEGLTALQLACLKGHPEMVNLLIREKADINKPDKEGNTPLHYAVSSDQPEPVDVLLKSKADGNKKNNKGFTPLHLAVAKKDPSVECLHRLLQFKCDPNTQDNDGDTPIHYAIRTRNKRVLDAFLSCSDLNLMVSNANGCNPFHEACLNLEGDTDFPQALIQRDPSIVNVPTKRSLTPLHIAAFNGFLRLAGILLLAKCNVNARDDNGKTALHKAAQARHLEIVQLLVESGADINCQDNDGNTPLHDIDITSTNTEMELQRAKKCKEGDDSLEIRCYLAGHGGEVSTTLRNNAGKTPMDFVESTEVRDMMQSASLHRHYVGILTSSIRLPPHWQIMHQTGFAQVELTHLQRRKIESLVVKTLPNKSVEAIHRIQNVALWEEYTVVKRNMEIEYGKGLANEQKLFHGTTPENAKLIPQDNVNTRLAENQAGKRYGQGAVFTVDAKYSDGYSKEDKKRHKFMFLARVLVGKTRQGNSSLKRPPLLDKDNPTKLADSACDNENSPSIYVIFSENQIYPEFLIEYS